MPAESERDKGVKDGDEVFERTEKLSSGSSEAVCVEKIELSIAVAMICMFFALPCVKVEIRHSSFIGLGVSEPSKS